MNLKELPARKTVKLLALVLTSLLIASVSAAVYYSMNMEPTVTIGQAVVYFAEGADTGYVTVGTNATYVSLSISAYPNVTLTYDNPLDLVNSEAATNDIRFRHVSITPASGSASVSNFTFINFTINAQDFDYTTSGDTWSTPATMGYQTMPASTTWDIKIETKAVAGATDALTVTIVIAVDVQ